jgi:hypothetical protein
MADKLKCGTLGEIEARYVCDHLFRNEREKPPSVLAYFEPHHEPHEPTPAIWCEACEAVVVEQDGIDERVHEFAQFRAVCGFCFQKYLDRHTPAGDG